MPPARRRTSHKQLQTVNAVIEELGGNQEVARLTGRRTQHVSNWRAEGRLPSSTYLVLLQALQKKGYGAPPELWSIMSP